MRERVLEAARKAGRDPSEITCAYHVEVRVDERADMALTAVCGPPDAVAARLAGFAQLGFSAFNFMLTGPDADEQAGRLAAEVIPAVRGAA